MLRFVLAFLFLTSCSLGTKTSGGKHRYRYEPGFDYTLEDLKVLSNGVVITEKRDPRTGKLDQLFDPKLPDLKRIGIIVFETQIQPTRTGLSDHDMVYVTEQGKQLITEKLLTLWDEGMPLMAPDIDYVSSDAIKNSRALPMYGLEVTDFIKTERSSVAPDDIMWLPPGKKTPIYTVMNPRRMRDFALMYVPASELMKGPKWSEQHKIFVNDIAKELKLDAVLVIMSKINWSVARKDKFTNENLPEELSLRIEATTLVPFGNYNDRLKELKISERPIVNVAYRYHEGKLTVPIVLNIPEGERNFTEIENRILNPLFKTYRDLSLMMIDRISTELRKTH